MTMMTVMTMLPTAGKISPLCIVEGRVMKKRFGILLLLSVLVVSLLTVVNVSANEIICSGYCGGDNTAEYDLSLIHICSGGARLAPTKEINNEGDHNNGE